MTDTTKKILYGAGIFIVIVVFLWGAWALVGSGGNTSSKPVVIPIDQTDHITGNPKSNVTFVEFSMLVVFIVTLLNISKSRMC